MSLRSSMTSIFKYIGYWIAKRLLKFPGNLLSFIVRMFVPVKKGRVACWAYSFRQYSCNPRYLTEYLLENNSEYEIYWIFKKNVDISEVDKRIRCVRFRSLEYFILINSAEFIFTNARTDPFSIYWHKRPGQKYAMLWHGGIPLKQIEKDVEEKLGITYTRKAKADSKVCDLMITGSRFQATLIKEKFWYDGEILESGIPRYDIFFNKEAHKEIREKVFRHYNIPDGNKVVLYAPTFRRNHSLEPYDIDWETAIPLFEDMLGGRTTVLLRLHPNMLKVDTSPLLKTPGVMDATRYHDMQELLCVCDLLITDYSSTMFDIAMIDKPCLLYATDVEKYDRGYYFRFDSLPFPLAKNMAELTQIVSNFNHEEYRMKVREFLDMTVKMFEDGHASERIVEWMKR
jgi:CDP-glycerol glycerophosphotransferase